MSFLGVMLLLIFLVFLFLFEFSSLMIELLRLESFEVLPWNMILGKLGTVSALIPNLKQLQLIIFHFFNTRCRFAFSFFFIFPNYNNIKSFYSANIPLNIEPKCKGGPFALSISDPFTFTFYYSVCSHKSNHICAKEKNLNGYLHFGVPQVFQPKLSCS